MSCVSHFPSARTPADVEARTVSNVDARHLASRHLAAACEHVIDDVAFKSKALSSSAAFGGFSTLGRIRTSRLRHIEATCKLSIYPLGKQTKGPKNSPRPIGPGFHSAVASIWSVKIILMCLWLFFWKIHLLMPGADFVFLWGDHSLGKTRPPED